MSFVVPELVEPVKAFATALGIGLLIGMERERRPDSAAGLRTFSLVAMLGCLFALLDERSGSTWMLAVGLLVIAGSMIASNFSSQQEEQYRGFTSEAAIVITYGLGAAVWLGYATLAVMLAIATTVLLYYIQNLAWDTHDLGKASAATFLTLAGLFAFSLINLKLLEKGAHYER